MHQFVDIFTYVDVHLKKISCKGIIVDIDTPRKMNVEPTNHLFRKEHDLPNLQAIMMFQPLIFKGALIHVHHFSCFFTQFAAICCSEHRQVSDASGASGASDDFS